MKRYIISEALNELAKGVKIQKEEKKDLKESLKENLNKKQLKESKLNESIKYDDLIDELASRVDDPTNDEDIFDAIDSGMIYYDDQWTAIEECCSPDEVMRCLEDKGIDVWSILYEDVLKRLEEKGLKESCQKEECQFCEDADDQVEVRTNEPGFISKMHELRDKGYKCVSSRPEKGSKVMVYVKDKSLKEGDFSKKTRQGWDIEKRFRDKRDGRIHVIANRHSEQGRPNYAIGLGYNDDKGYWGQGLYDYSSVEDAENALRHNNRYGGYDVDEITEEMSPEDRADSDVMRNVYKKVSKRSDAKVNDNEQKVLDKFGAKIQRKSSSGSYHSVDGDILDRNGDSLSQGVVKHVYNRDGGRRDWTGHYEIPDEVNLADRARKRPERATIRHELDNPNVPDNYKFTRNWKYTPGYNAEKIHGEINPEDSGEYDYNDNSERVKIRTTERHPYLTKERQRQATNMHKPYVDMERALSLRKDNQRTLDRVDKDYADDVSYAKKQFDDRMKDADERRASNRRSSEKGLADANSTINKLLKRK